MEFSFVSQVDSVRCAIIVKNPNGSNDEPPKTFTFDTVFGTDCKQVDIYNEVARPIVECVLEGYNGVFWVFYFCLMLICFCIYQDRVKAVMNTASTVV